MNRRHFVQRFTSLVAANFVPQWARSAGLSRKERIHIGAQTNAFGVPMTPLSRLLEVIGDLSKVGYEGFETNVKALEPGASQPAEWRREFAARNIRLISAHSDGPFDTKERADQTIEINRRIAGFTAAMGASYLILSGGGLPHVGGKLDLTAVHNTTEGLNRLGEFVKKEGLKLCYHNHWMEFADNPSEMSFILNETDPHLVWLNYDVGNAYGSIPNWNAVPFSREHFRRIAIYHLKDVVLNAQNKLVTVEFGKGKIDIKGVVAPLLDSDWAGGLTVEEAGIWPHGADHPEELMRQCRDYLHEITSV